MSNGKSLSGELSGYLNRVKESVRDKAIESFRNHVNDAVDNIWKHRDKIIETAWENNRDQIIETTRGKVEDKVDDITEMVRGKVEDKVDDITEIVQDIIRGKANRQIEDIWKSRGEITKMTRDSVEGITLAAHDHLKNAVEGAKGIEHVIRGRVSYQTSDIWRNRDEIIEKTGSKVKDLKILAQDNLKNPYDDAKASKDVWKNHNKIVATTGNQVKDITKAAQDEVKKAGTGAKAINDAIKDQVQTDKIWKNHDAIIETTGNKVKDATNMAQDKLKNADAGVKDQVTDRIDNVWKSRDRVIKTTGAEVKDMAKRAQDELGFRIRI